MNFLINCFFVLVIICLSFLMVFAVIRSFKRTFFEVKHHEENDLSVLNNLFSGR